MAQFSHFLESRVAARRSIHAYVVLVLLTVLVGLTAYAALNVPVAAQDAEDASVLDTCYTTMDKVNVQYHSH